VCLGRVVHVWVFIAGVDSSAAAISLAQRNAALNGFEGSSVRFVKADVSDFMRQVRVRVPTSVTV
jgi:23S rRNA G2069 N7-methylase RlmK/C1962 C5-methylase RlmI